MNDKKGFVCSTCGEYHDELPMSYRSPAPYYWFLINTDEPEKRHKLTSDLCVIDNKHFFIRGCIEIPVEGQKQPFIWDVWVSLSQENFERSIKLWNEKGREEKLEPMFGWLSTSLPNYPETLNLKTMVHTRQVGISPYIELEPTEHPLAVEQREGITLARVKEIAEEICNSNSESETENS
ncbi:hypothetical protein CLV36_11437 [Laceyella sediminis]|uniref:DUF2199 domain-containing protein n=1 Tax=Laceyella sediminis TaxID=573074 RepID=A0ABX5EKP4_9BACL|nr:DUF2199 domain-containing protein [Laceyella sediminis]PRZ12373.1 hypothetical protein CLV36_11437 [Laceyella sediminis]